MSAQKSTSRCEIGGGRMSPMIAYCYADEARGLQDAHVCAGCMAKHLEAHHGPDTPSGRNLWQVYGDAIPGCE